MGDQHDRDDAGTLVHDGAASAVTLLSPLESVAARMVGGAPRVGRAIDDARYERRSVLGIGGMGEVELCMDRRVGREVARKKLGDAVSGSASAFARFAREALVQARLEHPAIVPVYDMELESPELAWFTMKRIHGRSLHEVLVALREGDAATRAEYSRRKLLTAFVQVCLAIDYAHSRGVVHRDLKPANVMLGGFGEVNVIDWGIAKVVGERDAGVADLEPVPEDATLAGSLMGTPGYMAPEQARGAVDAVGSAADVYALGAILFELLTLEPLHRGAHRIALLSSTIQGADARPSVRAPDVPPELDEACVRATALDPAERPSARELARAVERYLDGDRDLARRRELAEEHVERAQGALRRDDPEARTEALRELGRAVALDPEHGAGVDLLGAVLTDAPTTVPAAARGELGASRNAAYRTAMRMAALRYLLWCAFVPLAFWMGIEEWPATVALASLYVLTAIDGLRLASRPVLRFRHALELMLVSAVATAASSCLFGTFMILPGIAATNTLFMAMHGPRRYRWLVLAIGVVAVVIPFALEQLGVIPPAYRFVEEGMLVVPRIARLPEIPSTVTLLATTIATTLIPGILAGRMRDQLTAAEKRLFLQAWHLRQMLPANMRSAQP